MKTSVALLGTFAVLSSLAWAQSTTVAVLDCANASDDAARLKCYDALAAQLRAPSRSSAAAAAPSGAVASPVARSPGAIAAPAAKSGTGPGTWPTDVNFGLQGEALRKAQERASHGEKSDGAKRQFVAEVTQIARRPGYPLTVVLDNGQVWEELVEGSDVMISLHKPVTIKAGIMGSFFLTDITHRTIRVRRVL